MQSGPRKTTIKAEASDSQVSDSQLSDPQESENLGKELMLCQAWPVSSCKVRINNIYGPGELPVKSTVCRVRAVEMIKGHVYKVELQLPAGKLPEFYAGQYLALELPGKEAASYFSIASAPGLREITLHIQADPHLTSAIEVIDYCKSCLEKDLSVSISLPYGKACLPSVPEKPLILMAAGTGFAQMKSIVEYLITQDSSLPIALYWGVRKEEDMYLDSLAKEWTQQRDNFEFHPLVADIDNIDANAHHNQLSDAVLADCASLKGYQVFVSGSPKLVYSAMDALLEAGLDEQDFYSDVLEYAPRS
jgi:CDP-4-dehydro-6-deoxyglucose reductase